MYLTLQMAAEGFHVICNTYLSAAPSRFPCMTYSWDHLEWCLSVANLNRVYQAGCSRTLISLLWPMLYSLVSTVYVEHSLHLSQCI